MSPSYIEILLFATFLILPFLYESNHVFRYRFKFFVYYSYVMVSSLFLIPIFMLRPGNVRNLVLASRFCKPIQPILGVRWMIRGQEILAEDRAYIIVSNHQSSLDIIGIFKIWPILDKCTVVAKKGLMYAGPFGLASYLCGLIFIPRLNGDEARAIMNQAAEKIKRDKTKLWVFPEGTRRNTGEMHPFKKGAFHLAIQAKIPILPVVYSHYYFLDKVSKRFDQGKIIITALPPIPTDNMTLEDIDQLLQKTQSLMTTTFHETNKEIKGILTQQYNHQGTNKFDDSVFKY